MNLLKLSLAPAIVCGALWMAAPAEAQVTNWGIYIGSGYGGFGPPPVRTYHYHAAPVYRSYWRPPAYYHRHYFHHHHGHGPHHRHHHHHHHRHRHW